MLASKISVRSLRSQRMLAFARCSSRSVGPPWATVDGDANEGPAVIRQTFHPWGCLAIGGYRDIP